MLDIKFIRENSQKVQYSSDQKGYKINVQKLLEVDENRREMQTQVDNLREQRNKIASQMKNGKPDQELIQQGREIKEQLAEAEDKFSQIDQDFQQKLQEIPNIITEDVPLGGEEDSVEIKQWGEKKTAAIDHLDFAVQRDWVDFERGAKVAGAKFYYLKGDLALLENAITQFALDFIVKKGFIFMTVPHLVNQRTMTGTGFSPRTSTQSDEYSIEGDDLSLIATAEIPLTGYHADEILEESQLPLFYAGYSACFRKEAGAAGKHTRGLFRVHQFNKLEMYAYCLPEQSEQIHQQILQIEEEIYQALELPYRVINIAAGDLGSPAAKKYDIEYWSPVDGSYREITSCSNCTDFQARNLNIRVRRSDGSIEILHTLNGTAVSLARSLVAILENYQIENNQLEIPKALRRYMNDQKVL